MRSLYTVVFAAALLFTLIMAWLPNPPALPVDVGDKTQHMAAFVVLSVLAALAFPEEPLARIGERLSFLGAIIEVVQNIPAVHRDCDIMDWLADTVAVIATLIIVAIVRGRATAIRTGE